MDEFLRILVAEENEVDSFVIQCELSKLDMAFTFKRVASRTEYFSQLEEFQPSLVLANNSFDGDELIHYTRTIFPNIPVVLIVHTTDQQTIESLLRNGATDCLLRRQLPQLKKCVEKVMEHCKAHKGEALPKPTCHDLEIVQKKSFLDRYFGAPARIAEVPANAGKGAELNRSILTKGEDHTRGTSLGTKLSRIKNKFRTTASGGAEEPALEARAEIPSVPARTHITKVPSVGTMAGFPVNPSIAGAGSSALLDGMEVPTIPCSLAPRADLEQTHQNQDIEGISSDLEIALDLPSLAQALDKNLICLQNNMTWLSEQFSRTEEPALRKQLLEVLNSMEQLLNESAMQVSNLSCELARWTSGPQNTNAEEKRIL